MRGARQTRSKTEELPPATTTTTSDQNKINLVETWDGVRASGGGGGRGAHRAASGRRWHPTAVHSAGAVPGHVWPEISKSRVEGDARCPSEQRRCPITVQPDQQLLTLFYRFRACLQGHLHPSGPESGWGTNIYVCVFPKGTTRLSQSSIFIPPLSIYF